MKRGTVLMLVGLLGCIVAGTVLVRPKQPASANASLAPAAVPEAPVAAPAPPASAIAEPAPPTPQPKPKRQPAPSALQAKPPPGRPGKSQGGGQRAASKQEVADPLARVALSFVGADPEAELYWYAAINDPRLSAHERSDLIEDLNEDGFWDPRRVGLEELPLVLSRLELIEEVAPYAMDQVNADAFAEAYKDLWNIASRLMGGGGSAR